MQYKLVTLIAIGLGATQTMAYSHGEEGQVNGKPIKWQQLAEGVFTGVPAEQWNDKSELYPSPSPTSINTMIVNKRGYQELDIDEIMSLSSDATPKKDNDLALEARELPGVCKSAFSCVKKVNEVTLAYAAFAWLEAAKFVSSGKIGAFLNQPFVANAGGVAVAGILSGQFNEYTKKQCSPGGSEADALKQAIEIAVNAHPDAGSISVSITSPAGTWTLDMSAKPEGQSPEPKCADA
jgi:hypothetical protein